jgi:RNA polymerase sigma-70 factor (ECF subfamily)
VESYFQNPGGFVMQLAKRKIYKHYSLRERFGNVISLSRSDDEQTAEIDPAEFETCIAQDDWPETAATNSVLIEQIGGYLKKQPADVQKIFRLYYYLDLQINEIAAELDMTESNVKNRLYRTLKALRKEFDVEG